MNALRYVTPLLCLWLLFTFSENSHAQLSVYAAAALTDFGFSNDQTTTIKSDSGGFIAGAFYNFPIQSRLTAGIDGRGSYSFGPRGGTSAAAALRIGFVPKRALSFALTSRSAVGSSVLRSRRDRLRARSPAV
jgi:hypothetical protein